ncbi:MAG: hypothetical protein C5B58_02670 [Acidobacteria bacterium]|nr:MAG: hypothetical protein C5B58_02670 [Acidobacteriota bacterium]
MRRFFGFGASLLQGVAGVFQAFADGSFGGLSAMLQSLAGRFRTVLDRLTGFSNRILILGVCCERQAEADSERKCQTFHKKFISVRNKAAMWLCMVNVLSSRI